MNDNCVQRAYGVLRSSVISFRNVKGMTLYVIITKKPSICCVISEGGLRDVSTVVKMVHAEAGKRTKQLYKTIQTNTACRLNKASNL